MRIIFAGTPEIAIPCLQALLDSPHTVVAVYTQPDRPAGRGQKLTASPVKQLALAHNLPVYQPLTLRDPQAQQELSSLQADLMVVIAYGLILPSTVLTIPRFGCINVHVSLLPRWRGAAPIQRAIIAGDTHSGVTLIQMDAGLDTGPILAQAECPITSTMTSVELQNKLAMLGSETLVKILDPLAKGLLQPQLQDETKTCYAQKIEKSEAEINWQLSAIELDRQVRGFNPWPVAYTYLQDQVIKIWQSQPLNTNTDKKPGTILNADKNGIEVATGTGILKLLQIQLPNSRSLPVADILNAKANLFSPGVILGKNL